MGVITGGGFGASMWRPGYRTGVVRGPVRSGSRTKRFYDALRFLCAATLCFFSLKLILLLYSPAPVLSTSTFASTSTSTRSTSRCNRKALTRALHNWTGVHASGCRAGTAGRAVLAAAQKRGLSRMGVVFVGASTRGGSRGGIAGAKWIVNMNPGARAGARKIWTVRAAASDKTGSVRMLLSKWKRIGRVSNSRARRGQRAIVVPSITLDDLFVARNASAAFPVSIKNSTTSRASKKVYGKKRVGVEKDATVVLGLGSKELIAMYRDDVALLRVDTGGHDVNVLNGAKRLLASGRVRHVVAACRACGRVLTSAGMRCTTLRAGAILCARRQ